MDFSWSAIDIEVINHNKRYTTKRIKLVKDAYGTMQKGLLAIMGPSGSGKTTLMNAFVGRVPNGSITTGKITWNHSERTDIEKWQSSIGFVDQDDTIYEELTAKETVEYSARFRLRKKCDDLNLKIEKLFSKLSLTHILDNKMKNLSGGERKRVMIAVELITDPDIIFLDEPTSGLDNNTTLKIIRLLKMLSQERIIIFTIHQPDDITADEFDKICLLTQGRTAYMGDYKECEKYLASKGFKREDRETFSNFAMRILDVEPGVYHETAANVALDKLVNDVKSTYKVEYTSKTARKSNDNFMNYKFNLNHMLLIYKRRLKILLFHRKNLIRLFVMFSLQALLFLVWRSMKEAIEESFGEVCRQIFAGSTFPREMKSMLTNVILEMMISIVMISIAFPITCAIMPTTAGVVFYPENRQVKREIGVNTYSCTSYYFAVYLFELTNVLCPFIMMLLAFIFVLDVQISIIEILMCLFHVFVSISVYFVSGSITKSPRATVFIFVIFLLFNVFPLGAILSFLRFAENTQPSLIHFLFNFFPNYPITTFIFHSSCWRAIDEIDTKISNLPVDPYITSEREEFITSFKEEQKPKLFEKLNNATKIHLIGFEISPEWAPVLSLIFYGLWILLGILLLSRLLKTPLRYRLSG